MNGIEAMKLMLDGNMVETEFNVVYKIFNNEICFQLNDKKWVKAATTFSEFIVMENFKEYKEPIILKRKCLILGEDVLFLNKKISGVSTLRCDDINGCQEIGDCEDCPFSANGTIDTKDAIIKEINFII